MVTAKDVPQGASFIHGGDALNSFFVTDLHGKVERYEKLFEAIVHERPQAVLLGGDLLPSMVESRSTVDFIRDYLAPNLKGIQSRLRGQYPTVLIILGNDDPRSEEATLLDFSKARLYSYLHGQSVRFDGCNVYGYSHVPPTPFLLKDWERYDVSRYVPPGCVSPEEGYRTVAVPEHEVKWRTIKKDLEDLVGEKSLDRAVFLMHTPPYNTPLDQAAIDGVMYDHVPLDSHVGSIAARRFIEERQPLLTLHGHIHESVRISGEWKTQIGRTVCISAAHDGPELALVRFDPDIPEAATRELL